MAPAWLGLDSSLTSRPERLTHLNDRLQLWAQAWQVITSEPLLGMGPMNFAALGDSFAAHPHNWVLQLAAEWGIPALMIALWILWRLGQSVRTSLRVGGGNDLDLLAPLIATLVGLVYGLVDGNLVMPVSQTMFAFSLGILLGNTWTSQTSEPSSRTAVFASIAGILVAALCLLSYVAVTLPQQADSENAWRRVSKYQDFAPRFWEQGLLKLD